MRRAVNGMLSGEAVAAIGRRKRLHDGQAMPGGTSILRRSGRTGATLWQIADVYRAPALCDAALPINIERR